MSGRLQSLRLEGQTQLRRLRGMLGPKKRADDTFERLVVNETVTFVQALSTMRAFTKAEGAPTFGATPRSRRR